MSCIDQSMLQPISKNAERQGNLAVAAGDGRPLTFRRGGTGR
jgi:hypothetical protein